MSDDPMTALRAAYVTQMQRAHAQNTRGIATPEQRQRWHDEANQLIADHDASIREQVAQDIKRARDTQAPTTVLSTSSVTAWKVGMARAFTIARKGLHS